MRKTLPLCTALLLGLLACGAALAQAPASMLPGELPAAITAPPQTESDTKTPLLQQLQAAVDSPLAGAQPRAALCSPPTAFVCVNKQCECQRFTCARCGIKSFTCDENTGKSSCVCKSC
ncbi:MAG TPA: hypothetical protein VIA62_22790 [Thermoanaerobaculia bacterium]|jgi:hypothetical protein|nr:hypothetical protein [Thermoanaerobaculia bacterium]